MDPSKKTGMGEMSTPPLPKARRNTGRTYLRTGDIYDSEQLIDISIRALTATASYLPKDSQTRISIHRVIGYLKDAL